MLSNYVGPHLLRVGPLATLPSVLMQLGFDPDEVLRGAGYSLSLFDNYERVVPFSVQRSLVFHCAQQTGCPHLGLMIGHGCELRSLGPLGMLLKYSSDIKDALQLLMRYQHYQFSWGKISLREDGEHVSLAYSIREFGGSAVRDHFEDGIAAALCAILRALMGNDWIPVRVSFSHKRLGDSDPFQKIFGCPIVFSENSGKLDFRTSHLSRKLPRHDPDLCQFLEKQLEVFAQPKNDLADWVLSTLKHAISARGPIRVQQLANHLGINPRTLHRRLHDSGTSFKKLLDRARFSLAREMLNEQNLTVSRVAENLGYSEPSAFVRAFRRWSGETPAAWRNEKSASSPINAWPI